MTSTLMMRTLKKCSSRTCRLCIFFALDWILSEKGSGGKLGTCGRSFTSCRCVVVATTMKMSRTQAARCFIAFTWCSDVFHNWAQVTGRAKWFWGGQNFTHVTKLDTSSIGQALIKAGNGCGPAMSAKQYLSCKSGRACRVGFGLKFVKMFQTDFGAGYLDTNFFRNDGHFYRQLLLKQSSWFNLQ